MPESTPGFSVKPEDLKEWSDWFSKHPPITPIVGQSLNMNWLVTVLMAGVMAWMTGKMQVSSPIAVPVSVQAAPVAVPVTSATAAPKVLSAGFHTLEDGMTASVSGNVISVVPVAKK